MRDWSAVRADAYEWLAYAQRDLLVAANAVEVLAVYEAGYFHAQQAAEKALKALLMTVSDGEIPRTHRLRYLTRLLEEHGVEVPLTQTIALLDAYGVGTRYPDTPLPSLEEAARATSLATEVVTFVQAQLQHLDELHEQSADDNQGAGTEDAGD